MASGDDDLETIFTEPSPAMLSAITKFLKDNDIGMSKEDAEELSGLERRLAEKRKGMNIRDLRVVGD